MISEIFDEIGRRIAAFFAPFLDWIFVAEWWLIFLIIFAVCAAIGYFFQFQWVRAVLGIVVLVAGAFVAGGTEMYRHIKATDKKRK
jgi:uncharacterized membrane-anchored protein